MNTLTGLIPTLYHGLHVVSRELVGMIPAVSMDATTERAAVNQTVRSPIGVAGALEDITPGVNPANSGSTTVDYIDMTITSAKAVPILWTGEEQLAVGPTGQYNKILADQFEDAFRKLTNAIEADLVLAAYKAASRAYGTAGTAPFGTANDLSDTAGVLKILEDNGAPTSDLQLVLNSAAVANLRGKQSVLFKVNEAGSSDMLRNGMTDRLQKFALRNSGQIVQHVKGGGASYVTNLGATLAVGDRAVAVDGGSGTILAGDVVVMQGDANKYIVNSALAGGSLSIGRPGLRAALADGQTVTVGNSYTPNIAFARSAVKLAVRAPALPKGGDSADDRMTVVDPFSGLAFEVSVYRQYRQVKIEVAAAWGVKGHNSEHIAVLLG
jgi:hypothetical protein